jgi:hypothetical protein
VRSTGTKHLSICDILYKSVFLLTETSPKHDPNREGIRIVIIQSINMGNMMVMRYFLIVARQICCPLMLPPLIACLKAQVSRWLSLYHDAYSACFMSINLQWRGRLWRRRHLNYMSLRPRCWYPANGLCIQFVGGWRITKFRSMSDALLRLAV